MDGNPMMHVSSCEVGQARRRSRWPSCVPPATPTRCLGGGIPAWMALPKDRRNANELERQVRRLVDRALKDFREDWEALDAPIANSPTRQGAEPLGGPKRRLRPAGWLVRLVAARSPRSFVSSVSPASKATTVLATVEPCSQPERWPSLNFPPPPGSSGWGDVCVTIGWRRHAARASANRNILPGTSLHAGKLRGGAAVGRARFWCGTSLDGDKLRRGVVPFDSPRGIASLMVPRCRVPDVVRNGAPAWPSAR